MWIRGTDIYLVRGDNKTVVVTMRKRELDGSVGEQVLFESGDTIYFTVKERAGIEKKSFQIIVTDFEEDGTALINILPSHTKSLQFKDYVYDIQLTDKNDIVTTIIECSKLTIGKEVTDE